MNKFTLALVAISVMGLLTGCQDVKNTNPVKSANAAQSEKAIDIPATLNRLDEAYANCQSDRTNGTNLGACSKAEAILDMLDSNDYCWTKTSAEGANLSSWEWVPCAGKSRWFGPTQIKDTCISSSSPAEEMRDIQGNGRTPETKDLPNGGVEVGYDFGGTFHFKTFFRSRLSCKDSLPRSKSISSKYE